MNYVDVQRHPDPLPRDRPGRRGAGRAAARHRPQPRGLGAAAPAARTASHRVISLDLPGFGLSQRMPAVTTLGSLADGGRGRPSTALGVTGPVQLMGNSLGGAVAMRMTVDDPGPGRHAHPGQQRGFRPYGNLRPPHPRRARPGPPVAAQAGRSRASPAGPSGASSSTAPLVTPERVELAVKIARQPDFAAVYLETARALGGRPRGGPALAARAAPPGGPRWPSRPC